MPESICSLLRGAQRAAAPTLLISFLGIRWAPGTLLCQPSWCSWLTWQLCKSLSPAGPPALTPHGWDLQFLLYQEEKKNDYWNKKVLEEKRVSENTNVCSKQSGGFLPGMQTPREADGWALCWLPQKHKMDTFCTRNHHCSQDSCVLQLGLFPTIDWSQTEGAEWDQPACNGKWK